MNPEQPQAPSHFAIARQAACAFAREQAAVTALEYALLGSLIAAVAAAGISTLGIQVQALWSVVASAVDAVM